MLLALMHLLSAVCALALAPARVQAYLRRVRVIPGQTASVQQIAYNAHVRANLNNSTIHRTGGGSLTYPVIDNSNYGYWIHVAWDADTSGNWLHRFYGCDIEYESSHVLN
jgi:hypothetical protein